MTASSKLAGVAHEQRMCDLAVGEFWKSEGWKYLHELKDKRERCSYRDA
jgi:hypothetical protein